MNNTQELITALNSADTIDQADARNVIFRDEDFNADKANAIIAGLNKAMREERLEYVHAVNINNMVSDQLKSVKSRKNRHAKYTLVVGDTYVLQNIRPAKDCGREVVLQKKNRTRAVVAYKEDFERWKKEKDEKPYAWLDEFTVPFQCLADPS